MRHHPAGLIVAVLFVELLTSRRAGPGATHLAAAILILLILLGMSGFAFRNRPH